LSKLDSAVPECVISVRPKICPADATDNALAQHPKSDHQEDDGKQGIRVFSGSCAFFGDQCHWFQTLPCLSILLGCGTWILRFGTKSSCYSVTDCTNAFSSADRSRVDMVETLTPGVKDKVTRNK